MKTKHVHIREIQAEKSLSAFNQFLRSAEDRVRRDVFLMIKPEDTDSKDLLAGYTIVYPGCSTRGHRHENLEEVYYFTKGKGIMRVGEEEFEVEAGDCVYVPFGPFHSTKNPYNTSLEFVWVTTPHSKKITR